MKIEKVNLGKKLVFILLIIILLTLIYVFNKVIIISKLQGNIKQYYSSSNYHIHTISKTENNYLVSNYFKKDNKQALILESNIKGEKVKTAIYNNEGKNHTYTEKTTSKMVNLNSSVLSDNQIINALHTDNIWQTILCSTFANIKSTMYNGKECYIIKNFSSPYYINNKNDEIYIEKITGLLVKDTIDNKTTERIYEFNNVEDSAFIEPDLSQYTIQNN